MQCKTNIHTNYKPNYIYIKRIDKLFITEATLRRVLAYTTVIVSTAVDYGESRPWQWNANELHRVRRRYEEHVTTCRTAREACPDTSPFRHEPARVTQAEDKFVNTAVVYSSSFARTANLIIAI